MTVNPVFREITTAKVGVKPVMTPTLLVTDVALSVAASLPALSWTAFASLLPLGSV